VPPSENLSYRNALDTAKRSLIVRALAKTDGNRAAAARALGLHEKYLLRLIKALRIG
jgi:transcriptional regulator with GAF, ATPase, and Fis domain